jgi:hypothetical protein
MCRSIKRLRQPQGEVSAEEVRAAALQFVRKVSGMHKPSGAKEAAFAAAIEAISAATGRLLADLPPLRARPDDNRRGE